MGGRPNNYARTQQNERLVRRYINEISAGNQPDAVRFHDLKRGQGLKSGSRAGLALALGRLDAESHGKPWRLIDDSDAATLLSRMRLQGYSDSNLINTASWCKHFLRWVRGREELPFRLILAFRVRRSKTLPKRPVLTAEEEDLLMRAAPSLRDQSLLALLIEGGLRITEAVLINNGDLHFPDSGLAWIRMHEETEGQKTGPRPVPLAKYAGVLRAYHGTKQDRDDPNAPFLNSYDHWRRPQPGRRLGTTGAWTAINRLRRQTGIRHFRPHDLRHTAITRASEHEVDLVALRNRFWGVPNSRQIGTYVHQSDEHAERMARRAAGLNDAGQALASTEKTCPACAETVKAAANKCKHCGEWIGPVEPARPSQPSGPPGCP